MIHKEKSNKMLQCIKIFIIPYLYEAQRVSGDALIASGFSYVEGCWTCGWWTLSGTLWKTRGCQHSFRLLMMAACHPKHI